MHQNEQICKLNFKNFLGLCSRPPYREGATAPLSRLYPPRRSGASRLWRLARGLRPLHLPPNQKSWIHLGRTHPLKILATPLGLVDIVILYVKEIY